MANIHSIIRIVVASIAALCLMWGCKSKTETPVEIADMTPADTTVAPELVEDTLPEELSVPEPPKKADELFDDFIFAFMKNKSYQRQRVAFPLEYTYDGETKQLSQHDWKFDSMYSRYEMYTLIFDSEKADKMAKDTSVDRVIVEELDLDTQRAKNYDFKRENAEWRLTSLTDGPMENSVNSEFYSFYHQFATDPGFRTAHIVSPLPFSTFDDDEFKTVETTLNPEEFEEHSPELPKSKITNILYGQTFNNSNLRILSLRAHASGFECKMVFKKNGGEWMLTRLEN